MYNEKDIENLLHNVPGSQIPDGLIDRLKSDIPTNISVTLGGGHYQIVRNMLNSTITKFAIAAMIIAAIIIGIANLTGNSETKQEIVDIPEPKQIQTPEKAIQQIIEAELKLAGAMYAAGNIEGLITLLDSEHMQTKVSVANYLADLSAEQALDKLQVLAEKWQGEDDNPFAIAIEKIKSAAPTQQNTDVVTDTDNQPEIETETVEPQPPSPVIDPNTLTDIYIIEGALRDGEFHLDRETWLKGDKYYRMEEADTIVVDNGVKILTLDKKAKTAQMATSSAKHRRGVSFDYIKAINNSVQNEEMPGYTKIIQKPDGSSEQITTLPKLILLENKSSENNLVYTVDPDSLDEQDSDSNIKLWVNANTLLLSKTLAGSQPDRGEQWKFNYDEIPLDKFSFEIPDGYTKLMDPKIVGTVIDADGNPMDSFDIYAIGYPWGDANGKSDNQGNFEFEIPTDGNGPNGPMCFPLLIRAVSEKYPNWVGWTIIQNPEDIKDHIYDWVPQQPDIEIAVNRSGCCAGIWGVELIVEPAFEISGIVQDRYNKPIKNASVSTNAYLSDWLFSKHWSGLPGKGKRGLYSVTTDDQGRYTISGIPSFAWIGFDDQMTEKEIADRKRKRHINTSVYAQADGYISKTNGGIDVREGFSSQYSDFVLSRADVTLSGRIVNNYGEPVPDRTIYYGEDNSFRGHDWRTDKDGRFKLSGAPASETLKIKIGSDKPADWERNKATKDKEYKYYLDKITVVGFEQGTNQYDLGDIVIEEPELTVEFEVKDTSGNAIEGLEISFYDHSMNHFWQQQFKAKTDIDGRCIFENYPDVQESWLSVQWRFTGQPQNQQEQQLRDYIKQFRGIYQDVKLPGDPEGYFVEVTVPRVDDKNFTEDQVRIYGSDGRLIWPIRQ